MAEIKPLSYQDFLKALDVIGALVGDEHKEFLYEIYSYTVEGIESVADSKMIGNLQGVNHLELIGYCVGEYMYTAYNLSSENLAKFQKDENIFVSISSVIADKYLSLAQFSYQEQSLANRFTPPISTLYVYVNFMLNIVRNYNKKDPQTSLLADLFMKSISICKCTLDLLIKGFETEAFSTWRTLHECECALIILSKSGEKGIKVYLKHLQYGLAFRDTIADKNRQEEIFQAMKEEMKTYDLKSKDIKKYIEYGWLYSIVKEEDKNSLKLNFRDGLEKVAGLEAYSKRYEMSSEIIHGTPLLVYSDRQYFYFITLLSTYESFFRLEELFHQMFVRSVAKEQIQAYESMRKIYYSHLVAIHKKESQHFKQWQTVKRTGNK